MLLIEDKMYYVYIYLDPEINGNFDYLIDGKKFIFNYEPFYVGKGKNNRIIEHLFESRRIIRENRKINSKNLRIFKILNKNNNPIFLKILENLTNNEASKIEKKIIDCIGRINNNTGPLTNLIRGGSGGPKWVVKEKLNWKKSIEKYYSNPENRKKAGYYNKLEYFISEYGVEEGTKKYNKRIERIKESIHEVYRSEELRNRCKNFGNKNGFFGKKSPTAIRIEVNGEKFNSIYDASVNLKIPYTTLSQRLKTKKTGYIIL